MKNLVFAAVLLAIAAVPLAAQTKSLTGTQKTVTASIEAIEHSTRQVTLKEANGEYVTITVPPDVKRFDTLKVGDTITAKYYENIVLRVQQPGDTTKDTGTEAVTPGKGAKAGVTSAAQRTITATITQLDPKIPSITFTGPNGWKYSSKVEDRNAIKNLKVGDKVDITWTDALLISVTEPTKK